MVVCKLLDKMFMSMCGWLKNYRNRFRFGSFLACASSLRGKALPQQLAVFGEVGLSGEIRPVPNGQERLKEAAKHGFKYVILPRGNAPQKLLMAYKSLRLQVARSINRSHATK
jgi:DNA repair protein RadA/Sms